MRASTESAPSASDAHAEGAGAIDGAAHDLVSRVPLDGHRFAGEHRLVDAALPVDDDAVGGDRLAGSHAELVTIAASCAMGTSTSPPGRTTRTVWGRSAEQPIERRRGATLGALLEPLAGDDEGDDADDRFVVDGGRHAVPLEPGSGDRGGDAEEQRRAGAERDEGVHVGRAVLGGGPGAHVEMATVNEHHGERQGQQDPAPEAMHWAPWSCMESTIATAKRARGTQGLISRRVIVVAGW